jgi:hypothetical protein
LPPFLEFILIIKEWQPDILPAILTVTLNNKLFKHHFEKVVRLSFEIRSFQPCLSAGLALSCIKYNGYCDFILRPTLGEAMPLSGTLFAKNEIIPIWVLKISNLRGIGGSLFHQIN